MRGQFGAVVHADVGRLATGHGDDRLEDADGAVGSKQLGDTGRQRFTAELVAINVENTQPSARRCRVAFEAQHASTTAAGHPVAGRSSDQFKDARFVFALVG